MNLVVDVATDHQVAADGTIVLQIEKSHRVLRSQCVISIGVLAVVESSTSISPLEVVAKVGSVGRSVVVDTLRRVEPDCSADGVGVGKAALGPHALCIEVDFQVIVEKSRAQVQRSRKALEVRSLQDTLLVGVATAYTIRKYLADGTADGNGVVMAESCAIDLVLPISIGCTKQFGSIAVSTITTGDQVTERIAVHHIESLFLCADGETTIIRNLRTTMSLLCCDDDDTVGATRTVDSRCGSILQHGEALDILWVNQ